MDHTCLKRSRTVDCHTIVSLRNSYRDGSAAKVIRTGDVMSGDLTLSIDDWMLGCSVNIKPIITCSERSSCYASNTIFF